MDDILAYRMIEIHAYERREHEGDEIRKEPLVEV